MSLAATMWVPMGAGVSVLSPNDHPNLSKRQQMGFGKIKFSKILRFHQQQFCGFRGGGIAPGYMGLVATTWVPMFARDPCCCQMTTQTHPTIRR